MPDHSSEFFVGYLPIPRRLMRFLVITTVLLSVALTITALLIGARQRDPGPGQWLDDHVSEFTGIISERPYPMLRTSTETLILVGEGKVGASELIAGWDGRVAKLRGTILKREGATLIEMSAAPQSTEVVAPAKPEAQTASGAARVVLLGEIIDPKCFTGAMKPGDGKPHKACAALCLRGGIPPMFTRINSDGAREFYLITDSDGDAASGELLAGLIAHIGEPVIIDGETRSIGEIKLLCIDARRPRISRSE